MALNFPNSPIDGQTYTDTSGQQWVYETTTNSWTAQGAASGGMVYKGGIDITSAPPAGATAGWLYTVTTGGTVNAGFTGLTGTLGAGTQIVNSGTGWQQIGTAGPWKRSGTELSPVTTGDSVFTSGDVKVGGTSAAPNSQLAVDGSATFAGAVKVGGTTAAPNITINGTTTAPANGIYAPAANQLAVATNSVARIVLDDNGVVALQGAATTQPLLNLTTSNNGSATNNTLKFTDRDGSTVANQQVGRIEFDSQDTTATGVRAFILGASESRSAGYLSFGTGTGGAAAERIRITSNGSVLFGATGTPSASTTGAAFQPQTNGRMSLLSSTSSAATQKHVLFFNPNGEVGSISTSASATAYTTSSDYRLKENVVPLTGAADRLNQLQVRRFNFISDPDKTVDGFIAHEAQAVVPEAVTGTKDEVDADGSPIYQGIDQSKLVPLLTAALQEALERIKQLEAKVATLEGGAPVKDSGTGSKAR